MSPADDSSSMSSAAPHSGGPSIFPAIDLRGGRVVRLIRGAGDAEIDYEAKPLETARRWVAEGAGWLHIIDLGSALGEADSTDAILEVAAALELPIQVGGGLREHRRIERLLEGGVTRVILGTRALEDPVFLGRALAEFGPDRVVLAMDIADGRVKISGWTEDSSLDLAGGIEYAATSKVRHLLVTAIDRDGTLSGPNTSLIAETLELAGKKNLSIVAAGGIGTVEHIGAVLDFGSAALEGVVVGRALYEGTVDLRAALELARATDTSRRRDGELR